MNLDQYPLGRNQDFLEYTFYSKGPYGNIEKRIRFKKISNDPNVYNLAFGNLDLATGKISDMATTNNKDTDKVLATVAAAVVAFFRNYPDAMVLAEGSTLSRTRLYRMRVAANLSEIQSEFLIYGLLEGKWELFAKNKPYQALLIDRI